ncbi:MAG: tetratricopeptide repeat protein [Nitrospinota bacterium]
MGLYSTLALVGALALSALIAIWLFYKRSHRDDFPEETWDPYLGNKGGGGEEEIERGVEDISGPTDEMGEPTPGGGSITDRLAGLEGNPPAEGAEEEPEALPEPDEPGGKVVFEEVDRQVELIGGAAQSPAESENPDDPSGFMMPSELAGGGAPASGEFPSLARRAPWWEGVAAPKEVPYRREVAELMGIAVVDSPSRKEDPAEVPPPAQMFPEFQISPQETADAPPGSDAIGETAEEPVTAPPGEEVMAGKEETTGDEEPEVSLAGTEELPGTEPPPASVDEIGGGIQEASLLEAGGPIEEDEAPIGEDESLPAGAEEVPGPAIPDAPISFEEKEFPGAEAAEAEPEEFQEPVFMPGEVAPGQEISGEPAPAAESPAEGVEDKGEEDSFTLESLVLDDEREAEPPIMYQPETGVEQPGEEPSTPPVGPSKDDAPSPEAETPLPAEAEPVAGEDREEEELPPFPADDAAGGFEAGDEAPMRFDEEDEGRAFIDSGETAQEFPAGLDSADRVSGEDSGTAPVSFEEEEGTQLEEESAGAADPPSGDVIDSAELQEEPEETSLGPPEVEDDSLDAAMAQAGLTGEPAGAILDPSEMENEPGEAAADPDGVQPDGDQEAPAGVAPVSPGMESASQEEPSALAGSEEAMDVFSVIEQERSGAPVDLPQESISNAALFDDADNGESGPADIEETGVFPGAAPPEAEPFDPGFEPGRGIPADMGFAPSAGVRGEARPGEEGEEEMPAEDAPDSAALPLSGGSVSEMVQGFVAECCPRDLLLIENVDEDLPSGIERIAAAGRDDIQARLEGRTTVDSEEFLRIGILEHMMGGYDEALGFFKETLRRADRMGPALNALAVASYGRGKTDPAISYSKEAIREAGTDVALLAAANRNLAILYQVKGDFGQAAQAAASAVQCLGSDADPRVLAGLHLRAGQLFRRLGEIKNAHEHLSEAAHLFLRAGDDAARIRSLVALSGAQTELNDFEGALKNLDQAALLCRSGGDKAGEALVMGQMGVAYSAQDQYTRALEHYGKAVMLNREMGNRKGEGANLSNVGNLHYFRGDLEEAISAYGEALVINREQNHLIGQATILGNLGRIFLEQNQADEAADRLRESLEIFRSAGAREQTEYIRELLAEADRTRDS